MKFLNFFIFGLCTFNFYSFSKEEAFFLDERPYDCTNEIRDHSFTGMDAYDAAIVVGAVACSYKILKEEVQSLLEKRPYYAETLGIFTPLTQFEKNRRIVMVSAAGTVILTWAAIRFYDLLKRQYYRYYGCIEKNQFFKRDCAVSTELILLGLGTLCLCVAPNYFEESSALWECYKDSKPLTIIYRDEYGRIISRSKAWGFEKILYSGMDFLVGTGMMAFGSFAALGGLCCAIASTTHLEEEDNVI